MTTDKPEKRQINKQKDPQTDRQQFLFKYLQYLKVVNPPYYSHPTKRSWHSVFVTLLAKILRLTTQNSSPFFSYILLNQFFPRCLIFRITQYAVLHGFYIKIYNFRNKNLFLEKYCNSLLIMQNSRFVFSNQYSWETIIFR